MISRSCVVLCLLVGRAIAQPASIVTGTITDAETGERLAAANIRILGTSIGSVANAEGRFRLQLTDGTHRIIVSSLGYTPDTALVVVNGSLTHNVALRPDDIILPEVVVTTEDPALEIMRRVIANKKNWADRLNSYTFDAFTRQVLRRDTAIASITESFTKGYWQKGDTLREIVKQRRQTENIKAEFNFASVGRIVNFYDDEIRFAGYRFVGPAATDAFDYYDYKLVRTRARGGREVYDIKVIPQSRTIPLFEGTLSIAGESYALVGVDVAPNDVFTFPFARITAMRYRQQFAVYEGDFWLPVDIRIDAGATINILGFSIPPIGFSQTSVITEYSINTVIPDSVFRKPRLTVDSAATATLDTSLWQSQAALPLTTEEQLAYTTLDSTQTLDVQFRPGGIGLSLGAGGGPIASTLGMLDVAFNRVEGLRLGAKWEVDSIAHIADMRGGFAYGFSQKRMMYMAGATLFTTPSRRLGFGADVYRQLNHRPDAGYYGTLYNSLTSIFVKNDYRDYYEAEGWSVFMSFRPGAVFRTTVTFLSEEHRSVQQHTDFSLFARRSTYRSNPPAAEGLLRSIALTMLVGREPVPLDIVRQPSLELSFEYSDPSLAQSEFRFTRVQAMGSITVPTFGRSLLFPAALSLRIAAGVSSGQLPPQRFFDLESASSNLAPFGVFKAMHVKEYSGERFVAATVEHNFRTLLFRALGIPFLYNNGIEFILHGGAGRTWIDRPVVFYAQRSLRSSPYFPSVNSTDGWYGEFGFGFNRIFELFRTDFTWRLSSPGGFRLTLGVANVF